MLVAVPGVGVSLYFYYVRSLALFFAVAALLHVPHIILCYYGGMLAAYKIGTTQMGSFTAANHLIKYPVGPRPAVGSTSGTGRTACASGGR